MKKYWLLSKAFFSLLTYQVPFTHETLKTLFWLLCPTYCFYGHVCLKYVSGLVWALVLCGWQPLSTRSVPFSWCFILQETTELWLVSPFQRASSGIKLGWSQGSSLLFPFSWSSHSGDASCPVSEHSWVFCFLQFSGCWPWEGWSSTSSSLVARHRNASDVFSSWSLLVWRNPVDSCRFY